MKMILQTAQKEHGDEGFARFFRLNKYGENNTIGKPLRTTQNHIFRLSMMGLGHTIAQSCILHVKNFTESGSPRIHFTTDTPLMRNLEIYIEETIDSYILIVKHPHRPIRIVLELLSAGSSGYLDWYNDDRYRYFPTGKLLKPHSYDYMETPSTGSSTNQWSKIATIKTDNDRQNYTTLLTMFESNNIQTTSQMRLFSVQIRHENINDPVRVNIVELTSSHENRFEVYSKATNVPGSSGEVEIWVKVINQFSSVCYHLNVEATTVGVWMPSVQYHIPTYVSQPQGTLVKSKSQLVKVPVTFQNGWSAVASFQSNAWGNADRVDVTFIATGGTTANGTTIASVGTSLAPSQTIYIPCMVVASDNTKTLGNLAIFTSGNIQIQMGALETNHRVIANFSYGRS